MISNNVRYQILDNFAISDYCYILINHYGGYGPTVMGFENSNSI